MIIFPSGITITDTEQKGLLYMVSDPEVWLLDIIAEKSRMRREQLIHDWQPWLFADPSITELPADVHELCELIMARSDYKTRLQKDAEEYPLRIVSLDNVDRYEAIDRSGATTILFADGMDLSDIDCHCILAYVKDLEDWVLGALLGQLSRGKKLMIEKWQPIILADPDVSTMPATEDGLIDMIIARDDYQNRNN
jgi:hypothetical protein